MIQTSKLLQTNQPCPFCPSTDAYQIYEDGGFCFSCGYKEKENNIISETEFTTEYLDWRGISKDVMKFYGAKTRVDSEGKPFELELPFKNSILLRKLDKKLFTFVDGYDHSLFGVDKFDANSSNTIYITEGALDAMSLYQMYNKRYPCIAVFNTSSARTACEQQRDFINSFDNIYLVFDGDPPGQKAAELVAGLFDPTKVYIVKMTKYKDANEYLQASASEELKIIIRNTKSYKPTNIISKFADIRSALEEPSGKIIATYPFPTIQGMTYGIREGERILITAQEGIGKTEIIRAMEYHALKSTDLAIGAIHLEESKTRTIKGLVGYELRRPAHLPTSKLTNEDLLLAYQASVGSNDSRYFIYTHFGTDDPRLIIDTIRRLVTVHHCKIIFFDHITMAVTGLGDEDERRALDQLSTSLAMLTEELQFAIVFISHVNDFGQTRGSRYISKICDVRITLDRDLTSDDPITRNTTKTTIVKNRFSGLTGPSGDLYFDSETFTVSEQEQSFGIPSENISSF